MSQCLLFLNCSKNQAKTNLGYMQKNSLFWKFCKIPLVLFTTETTSLKSSACSLNICHISCFVEHLQTNNFIQIQIHSRILVIIPDFICNIISVVKLQQRAYSAPALVHITDTPVFIHRDNYFYVTLKFAKKVFQALKRVVE